MKINESKKIAVGNSPVLAKKEEEVTFLIMQVWLPRVPLNQDCADAVSSFQGIVLLYKLFQSILLIKEL